MSQERAEANDIAYHETNCNNHQCQSQGNKKLERRGIIGSQLFAIGQQKAR